MSTDADGTTDRTDGATAGTKAALDRPGLLSVRDLDAGYGDLQILDGVDLDVRDGEYVTVVGPNGAGKSTVMKSVFGLTTHMGGSITFDGDEITGLDPEDIIHEGLGYVLANGTNRYADDGEVLLADESVRREFLGG